MTPHSQARSPLLNDIWQELRSRPGRFALSMFAMSLGMSILSALIAMLLGLEEKSRDLSKQLGTNVVAIFQEDSRAAHPLLPKHTSFLRSNYPNGEISGIRHGVETAGVFSGISIAGVEPAYFQLRDWQLVAGRLLDERDLRERKRVAVVSEYLLEQHQLALGMSLPLGMSALRIVGVVSNPSNAISDKLSDGPLAIGANTLYLPLTLEDLWDTREYQANPLDGIFLRIPDYDSADQALSGLQALLEQPDLALERLTWVIPSNLIDKVRKMQGMVALTVGAIATLCLSLGGTTLSSILVSNVRERVAEIGLRRALGASRTDITVLFIVEGCVVAVAAALVGALLAHVLLATELASKTGLPISLGISSLMLPLAMALLLGTLFSFIPARSAAKIKPAEALKFE
ncbi:MAG: ABC transporter permease [Pseudomonadota bacterium]